MKNDILVPILVAHSEPDSSSRVFHYTVHPDRYSQFITPQ